VIIEKIGLDAPLAAYGLDENRVPIVPTGGDASSIVAWYDFSAPPGTGGNAVYAGHVTWNGPAVFYNLSALAAGDLVRLRDDRGAEVVYQVTANFEIDPRDQRSLEVMYPTPNDVITIITCAGSFYSTSDPVAGGDYTARTVIRAELVSVTRA
jgi:LPXTG-site transpeptidase (sortase) family protein